MSHTIPHKLAVERTCYELCETGRFNEALLHLRQRRKFLSAQEAADILTSLEQDYREVREAD